VPAAAAAAEPAEHRAARDWALPKTERVTSGLVGRETAGAALAIELMDKLRIAAVAAHGRTALLDFIDYSSPADFEPSNNKTIKQRQLRRGGLGLR
jgi:hypothetical protein